MPEHLLLLFANSIRTTIAIIKTFNQHPRSTAEAERASLVLFGAYRLACRISGF